MTGDELDALEALPFGVAGGITDMPPGFGHETEEARRRAIVEIVEEADRQGADADGIADALLDEADRWAAAREPAGAGLRTPSDALRPFLRHEPWCNCKTDDDPDTQRCKCGLRAALVSPAEPGLDVTMNDSRVVTGGLPDPAARSGLDVEREARVLLTLALDHDDYVLIHRDNWSRFRAALAAPPAEPGLGRLRRIEAAAFSLVSTFSVLPVPILTEHDHAALRALRAALSVPKP